VKRICFTAAFWPDVPRVGKM